MTEIGTQLESRSNIASLADISDMSYTAFYMEVDSNGFHIGFAGDSNPFISIYVRV